MRRYLTILCLAMMAWLYVAAPSAARQSLPIDTGKVTASLVSTHDRAAPGQSFYVALHTQLDAGWHTYWRNSGDSGEPVHIQWTLPEAMTAEGLKPGGLHWPLPHTLKTGPFINYGFEGAPIFPAEFTIPVAAKAGDILTLEAEFFYLVCADVCVPENGAASLLIEVGEAVVDDIWAPQIETALLQVPRKSGVKGAIRKEDSRAIIEFTNLPEGDFSKAYFFPHEKGVVAHSQPQMSSLSADKAGLQIKTDSDFLWDDPALPQIISGVLAFENKGIYSGVEVDLSVNGALDIGSFNVSANGATRRAPLIGGVTFWGAIIGAFLGGLILNLMPCVFPIISLKALSLSKTAHSQSHAARRKAWAYAAGVLASFMILAVIMLAIKGTGAAIGWGFQLQSPKIIGWLALLFFIIGLNLLGVFELGFGLQNIGSDLVQKDGLTGAFFTGALAVIVATPCTAPFMAGAMGYALAQAAPVTGLIFIALGFGFALPFLILGYAPILLTRLPKPGPWMVRFKELLAFPIMATAIWFVWILSQQAGSDGVLRVLAAALLTGFAIWLLRSPAIWAKALAGLSVIAALILPFNLSTRGAPLTLPSATLTQPWSQAAIADNLSQGRAVFVDFTAAWCVTCKVNKRLVINTAPVQDLFAATNTAMLVADWTNKDDVIAAELERYGRAGVPLYLVYTPETGADKGKILPQILTYDVIKASLE